MSAVHTPRQGKTTSGSRVSKRGNLVRNLGLLLASTSLTMLGAGAAIDIYLRCAKPRLTPDTERHASLEYDAAVLARHGFPEGRQETRAEDGTVRARINRLGFRGHAFLRRKPTGRIRVLVVGGSAAFDIYAREGRDWPHRVERTLRRRGWHGLEVVNAGTPGHATWDVVGRLYGQLWMLQPDYVVVYETWNDIKYFRELTPVRSLLRLSRPLPTMSADNLRVFNPFIYYTGPIDRLLCHSQLYTRLRRRYWWWRLGMTGLEGLLVGAPDGPKSEAQYPASYSPLGPRQFGLDVRLIANLAREIGATPVFLTQARLLSPSNTDAERQRVAYDYVGLSHAGLLNAFADADRELSEAARSLDVPFLDLAQIVGARSELFVDHIHTTPAGSAAIARAVARFLEQLLPRTTPPQNLPPHS